MARHPQAPKADDRGTGRTMTYGEGGVSDGQHDRQRQRNPAWRDRTGGAALATATSAAEILDAKRKAGFAYTTAKAAARFAEAKNAHAP